MDYREINHRMGRVEAIGESELFTNIVMNERLSMYVQFILGLLS